MTDPKPQLSKSALLANINYCQSQYLDLLARLRLISQQEQEYRLRLDQIKE